MIIKIQTELVSPECTEHAHDAALQTSLVPRPVRKIGEEGLVSTVCACA